jgi:hypothetical protein
MSDGIQLRLKWRRTWPDIENDFVGLDERAQGGIVGRIIWNKIHEGEHWTWSMTAFGPGINRPHECHGRLPTPREAAAAVEAAWLNAIGES